MSQNMLETGSSFGRVRVRAGWDVPNDELFCNVEQLETETVAAELPECFFRTSYGSVEEITRFLAEAGITLPSKMMHVIKDDLALLAGNVLRIFSDSGEVVDVRRI